MSITLRHTISSLNDCYRVCGSYADMHSGCVSEALMDFTGGVHMHYELKTAPTDLWEIMYRAFQSEVLMGCATPAGVSKKEKRKK